jgi:hypothetical protein
VEREAGANLNFFLYKNIGINFEAARVFFE